MKSPYQLVQESYSDVSGFEIDHIAVETALSEADQLLEEISETAHYVEATESVESNLALIARYEETLAAAVESGEGIDKAGLDVVNMSVTSIMSQLGFPNEEVTACATESYGSPVSAAMEAMEGTKKNLSKAYAVVRATIKAIFHAIVKFFKTFGLNAKKLVDGAKAMLREVTDNPNQVDREKWEKAQKASAFGRWPEKPADVIGAGMEGLEGIITYTGKISDITKKSIQKTVWPSLLSIFSDSLMESTKFYRGMRLSVDRDGDGDSRIVARQVPEKTQPTATVTKDILIDGLRKASELDPKKIVELSEKAEDAATDINKALNFLDDDKVTTAKIKSLANRYQMLSTFMLKATLVPISDVIKLGEAYIASTK